MSWRFGTATFLILLSSSGCREPGTGPGTQLLRVDPPVASVVAGDTVRFDTGMIDRNGAIDAERRPEWSVSDESLAGIDSSGLLTARNPGEVVIIASLGGDSARAAVTISPLAFASISAGGNHTCGRAASGRVWCWGRGESGELGPHGGMDSCDLGGGTMAQCLTAPAIVDVAPVAALTTAAGYTCGDAAAGAICWGLSTAGQFGAGPPPYFRSPGAVTVQGPEPLVGLSAGGEHACGLDSSGRAFCWGSNAAGQLGTDLTTERCPTTVAEPVPCSTLPVPVQTELRFSSLSAGGAHTCALTSDGVAYCWGEGVYGALGSDEFTDSCTGVPCSMRPVRVHGDLRFVTIGAGDRHTCAVTATGEAYCWGDNRFGQLGVAAPAGPCPRSDAECGMVPIKVSNLSAFKMISAGGAHTCALAAGGTAYCWGANFHGALGDGTAVASRIPSPVAPPSVFSWISAGAEHTCALTTAGVAYCWGFNAYGQLGNATTTSSDIPTVVAIPSNRP